MSKRWTILAVVTVLLALGAAVLSRAPASPAAEAPSSAQLDALDRAPDVLAPATQAIVVASEGRLHVISHTPSEGRLALSDIFRPPR